MIHLIPTLLANSHRKEARSFVRGRRRYGDGHRSAQHCVCGVMCVHVSVCGVVWGVGCAVCLSVCGMVLCEPVWCIRVPHCMYVGVGGICVCVSVCVCEWNGVCVCLGVIFGCTV